MAIAALFSFAACNDTETYKDLRDRELDSISSFLRHENVKVISEEEFKSRWEKKQKDNSVVLTDTSKNNNEYVLFNSNGIYMQVLEMGCGDYIKMGETTEDNRFTLEICRCVGACSQAPVVMIDEDILGRVSPADVSKSLRKYE